MEAFISRHPFLEFLYCRVFLSYLDGDLMLLVVVLTIMIIMVLSVVLLCDIALTGNLLSNGV